MTDIGKEAVTHSAATCLLLDGRFVREADYRAQAARIAELEAAERKSRGYRVGYIAGHHAALRAAVELLRTMGDMDGAAIVQDIIDKEPAT